MRRIELYLTPQEAGRAPLENRQLVVVDVLLNCTTVAHALRNV